MYSISNYQRDELILLLSELKNLPGSEDKTLNSKRRANVIIKKLGKLKKLSSKKNKKNTL